MRETKNDREQRKEAARLALCLWAGVICVTMLCSEVLGNKIDDVTVEPHYLETWSPVNCGESVCQCKYWVYVTWDVDPGSNQDSFTVEIWQPGEPNTDPNEDFRMPSGTMIGANSVGPSPLNTKVEITDSDALKPGEHTIRAWVAGNDISSPGKWGHSDECTVYIAEVNDIDPDANEVCVDCNVTFTADPNPPGKELRCMEWQKGYKPDSSGSWTWDPPETGGASRILNTSTPGIYSYRARNCKDYGCADCNWVQSEDVNVKGMDSVTADKSEVCDGENVTFTAVTAPAGYESSVFWNCPLGTPATGTGATFTTKFTTGSSGGKLVSGSYCGDSKFKVVYAKMGCDCRTPEDSYHNVSAGFGCPGSSCGTNETDPLEDNCWGKLKIQCSEPKCWYRYLFSLGGGWKLIGHCPYYNGVNWFRYKKTINDERFHSTWYRSHDPDKDGTAADEGTLFKYDWVVWKYDCINAPASPEEHCREDATTVGDEDDGDNSSCERYE